MSTPRVGRSPGKDRNSAPQSRPRSIEPRARLRRLGHQAEHRAADSGECRQPYRELPDGPGERASPFRRRLGLRLREWWRWPCLSAEHSRIIMTRKSPAMRPGLAYLEKVMALPGVSRFIPAVQPLAPRNHPKSGLIPEGSLV